MRLAIMQPYFLPYLGYFQLLHCADKLVLADSVQMIRGGWVARNRICQQGRAWMFSVPVAKHPHTAPINTIRPAAHFPTWRRKFLRTVRESYSRARNFAEIYPMLAGWLAAPGDSLAALNARSITAIARWLGISTPIVTSSEAYPDNQLAGLERLFDICRREGATCYLNAPGGRTLYQAGDFAARGLQLEFLDPVLRAYPQFSARFLPGLSILDLIMHVPRSEAHTHASAATPSPALPA